jgi:hypothetical protein
MARMLARSVGGVGAVGAAVYALSPADANGKRSLALGLARLDDAVRPALASVLPAEAFICLYSASRTPFIHALSAAPISSAPASPLACVRAMGLSFRNDLGNAAGLDKDGSLLDFNYSLGAGFAVVGTVLSEPHTGNVFSFFGGLWKGNVWDSAPALGCCAQLSWPAVQGCRRCAREHRILPQPPWLATAEPGAPGERRRQGCNQQLRRHCLGRRFPDRSFDHGPPRARHRPSEEAAGRARVRAAFHPARGLH